jgi:hypothetical protein
MLVDWQVNYNATDVTLEVLALSPAGIPGDYNNDGIVDAADYVVFRKNEGTPSSLANDPIGGVIGQGQYDQWRAHFSESAIGSSANANSNVPEPSAFAMLIMAAAVVPTRRRKLTSHVPKLVIA